MARTAGCPRDTARGRLGTTVVNRIAIISVLLGVIGCTTTVVPQPPATVRRIAVLPPNKLGDTAKTPATASVDALQAPRLTVGDVLAAEARLLLAQKGFQVVDPTSLEAATAGRVPTSPQMAAQIVADAHLDATPMYIEVAVWQPSNEGMQTTSVIVALNVMLVDAPTGRVVWQVRRAPKPVPLYGTILTGQADVFAAETVMREVLAPLGPERTP